MTETAATEATPTDSTTMTGGQDPNEGTTEYLVRLLFRIPAKTPEEAVEKYVEQIVSHGLRNWSYRVEDEETGDMWHLDGYGDEVQPRAVVLDEEPADEPADVGD